jgi:hypothetical protein
MLHSPNFSLFLPWANECWINQFGLFISLIKYKQCPHIQLKLKRWSKTNSASGFLRRPINVSNCTNKLANTINKTTFSPSFLRVHNDLRQVRWHTTHNSPTRVRFTAEIVQSLAWLCCHLFVDDLIPIVVGLVCCKRWSWFAGVWMVTRPLSY